MAQSTGISIPAGSITRTGTLGAASVVSALAYFRRAGWDPNITASSIQQKRQLLPRCANFAVGEVASEIQIVAYLCVQGQGAFLQPSNIIGVRELPSLNAPLDNLRVSDSGQDRAESGRG